MKVNLELIFPGKLKEKAIICNLCKKFHIEVSIKEASFSTEIGWALLQFSGREKEINSAIEYLRREGVKIEDITKKINYNPPNI
ncbi:MAG: NIL domain-containing protein [Candidatus Omnitrophica bacterium]|nr:NIL domain-containing protein [Candidatus Omnitrophota bacterium]